MLTGSFRKYISTIFLFLLTFFSGFSQDWIQIGNTFEGEDGGNRLGRSVAINKDGSVVVMGEPESSGYGKVKVYEL